MKRLLLLPFLVFATFSFSQIVDQFNYGTALDATGWVSHGGTAGQIVPVATASDQGNSLAFNGLEASLGNRINLIAGNNQDVNKALSGITGTGYYSLLLKVQNTTGMNTSTGDYFAGFGVNNTPTLTTFGARLFVKPGVAPGTFKLGIQNYTGGTPTQSYESGEHPVGTTVFVVVKFNTTTAPYTADLFVNPVPGAAEPVATATNTSGTTTNFTTFGSLFIRQGGTASSGTGNLEIDEIRAGSTWAFVTPAGVVGCNTTSSINVSACTSYTVPSGDEVYNTSGIYHDTIPNAAMCDSVITINLTITGGTTSSFSVTNCTSYTVPSGDETYFASGIYMDTIPNHLGCDSVMTINVTIVTGITYYQDFDTDGLGNPSVTTVACTQPVGYVTNSNDCNDNDNLIGAATTWYLDADLDGYGSSTSMVTCTPPSNYVSNNTDCNDANSNVHPGGTEIPNDGIDQDCSGGDLVIAPTPLAMYEFTGNDCTGANVNVTSQPANAVFGPYNATLGTLSCSAAANVFNHSNWNLTADVTTDEYYSFTVTPASCYEMDLTELHFTHKNSASGANPTIHIRSSLDGFATDIATVSIVTPNVLQNENIALPVQFTGLTSTVEFRFYVTSMATNGATYRHDDVSLFGTLNALPTQTYYADADGDTYGDPAVSTTACVQPVGYVTDGSDCDDTDENAYPGAVWAVDNDADGFAGATTMVSCTQPANHIPVSSPVDCDDNNNAVTGETMYYADTDNDGYGDANSFVTECSQPSGYVTNDDDCDDSDNSVGLPSFTYYMDLDGDMYGDPNSPVMGCAIQVGLSPNNLDCDDNDSNINPDAVEICDNIDNNCDGNVDEGLLNVAYYEDADNDGFGNSNSMISDCAQPAGYVTVGGDCDDTDDQIYPDATDVFGDAIDQNCDGVDGYLSVSEDVFFEISASPNPGNTFVMVAVSENFGTMTAEMISSDGRAVNVPFSTVEGGVEIQTASLVPGMYIIRLSNGNVFTTVRWIKL